MIQFNTILEALTVVGVPSLASLIVALTGLVKFIAKCKELKNENINLKDEITELKIIAQKNIKSNQELSAKIDHIKYVVRDIDGEIKENKAID